MNPEIDLQPPTPAEVDAVSLAVMSAIRVGDATTEFQQLLMGAAFESLTGHSPDTARTDWVTPEDLAVTLARRNEAYRSRIVQTMILGALVLRPLPVEVADRVEAFAAALGVEDGMLSVARGFASEQYGLAAVDFDRNGYTSDWDAEKAESLHADGLDDAWATAADDPELAARWKALADLPESTLGHQIWRFYRARGFAFPGMPGSAPPLLAQHDWVHVIADYGTRVESELEVFAFIARANDDPRGFSLLAMVVSLFETGNLERGAGLFEAFPGQLSRDGMAERLADGLRRGALCHGLDGEPDVDFMALDWFELVERDVEELRAAFGIVPKSESALAAGSVGPWEAGGISEFQDGTGRAAAEADGRPYESYGAAV